MTTCISSGPSVSPARRGPVSSVVYTVSFWPVPDRASSFSSTARSAVVGTSRSIPIIATCTRGIELTSRPLPSFVTRQIDPVDETPKFAPVIPTSAFRNVSRSCRRAAFVERLELGRDRRALDLPESSSATCSAPSSRSPAQ